MGMKPQNYNEAFVQWNLCDCKELPGDIRRIFNAAVSVSHLADHYFNYNKRHHPELVSRFREIGDFVEYLTSRTNGNFKDVRSIANVYKHLYTDVGRIAQYSSVSSCGSIESIDIDGEDDLKSLEEDYIESKEQNPKFCVMLTRKDGTKAEVLPLLESVAEVLNDIVYNNV
jgi:hypothetical protein